MNLEPHHSFRAIESEHLTLVKVTNIYLQIHLQDRVMIPNYWF